MKKALLIIVIGMSLLVSCASADTTTSPNITTAKQVDGLISAEYFTPKKGDSQKDIKRKLEAQNILEKASYELKRAEKVQTQIAAERDAARIENKKLAEMAGAGKFAYIIGGIAAALGLIYLLLKLLRR